ncbi:MAG: AAA family ATPase [Gammaproteobacteria bacterium]|nr:AAA family ATPase [Gammaproteobacteria bacterium]
MKISITGSAGTGKSTIASLLAEHYSCACIDEFYEGFFQKNGEFVQPVKRLREMIFETLEKKYQLEEASGNFVVDRSPVDLFNLWLSRGFTAHQDETTALYQRCRELVHLYDAIVVLPWGVLPLQQHKNNQKRRRIMNPWVQFHNHSTIVGLTSQWLPPDKIIPIPGNIKNNASRIAFIDKHFN